MSMWDSVITQADRGRIMVVTDRYPPNAHGGAELSLHILLSHLGADPAPLVVAFNETIGAPHRYTLDGIDVVELPSHAPWPYHQLTWSAYKANQDAPRGVRGGRKVMWLARYLLGGNPLRLVERLRLLRLRYLRPVSGGPIVDFDEYGPRARAAVLRSLIKAVEPRLIHADNYRSILSVYAAGAQAIPTTCLVRDNRFFCVRHDQAMNIRGRVCGPCGYECVDRRRADRAFVTGVMGRTRTFRHAALASFDEVMTTSRFLVEQLSTLVNKAVITRVPNATDSVDDLSRSVASVAEDPGFNVLIVGMLNENKGQLDFIKTLPDLIEQAPQTHVYFAGRGDRIQAQIEKKAKSLGIADRVHFLGYQDRTPLYEWMRRCQVVALPTVWPEPFGRVPLEAGLVRRPIVAFDIGGLRETIVHERTGLLARHRDYQAFNAHLARLAHDPVLRRTMGYAGYEHVLREYSPSSQAEKLCAVWTRHVGKHVTFAPRSPSAEALALVDAAE